MRIALAGDIGSPTDHIEQSAAAYEREGHDVAIYSRRGSTSEDAVAFMNRLARQLDDVWAGSRPDVVHAFDWAYGVAAQLAARRHGIPTVQTFAPRSAHRPPGSTDGGQRAKLETLLAVNASWLAPRCTEEMFTLLRLGAKRSRMSVLGRGVDVDTFVALDEAASRNGATVAVFGDDPVADGLAMAIRALRGVAAARLLVVGNADTSRLQKLARSCGVADRIRFAAAVPYAELPDLLAGVDVVACPPPEPPHRSLALEAMAAGVPVVATATGELVDLVVHDVTGLLVMPGNAAELATALRRLLADPFRRRGMGMAGRNRAASRFGWDQIATESLAIYERLRASNCEPLAHAMAHDERRTR